MKRGIAVAVSAMILAWQLDSPIAAQEPTLEELVQISEYLDNNDIEGLRAFLLLNPQIILGESSLSRRLREFVEAGPDLPFYLGWEPATQDDAVPEPNTQDNEPWEFGTPEVIVVEPEAPDDVAPDVSY